MDFCKIVREAREAKYKSARAFHKEAKLSCSYYYYSQVETRVRPELPLALEIVNALDLNRRSALYAWVRDLMPDSESKAYFVDFGTQGRRSSEQSRQGRSLVLNRLQAKLLKKDPLYWELMLLIYCHFGHQRLSKIEIAQRSNLSSTKVEKYLRDLFDYGLIERDSSNLYYSREWIYIPFEKEFQDLRDLNFIRAVERFHANKNGFRMRTTITRLLTPSQQREVESLMTALHNAVIDLPDETPPPEARPFTVGVFGSERRFGND